MESKQSVTDDAAIAPGPRRLRNPEYRTEIADHIAGYLGCSSARPDDVRMREAFLKTDRQTLARIAGTLKTVTGRVFVIGNGGSFDNARLIAARLRRAGLAASTPANDGFYRSVARSDGYDAIFAAALRYEGLTNQDLLIAISGSGNSPNILQAVEAAQSVGAGVVAMSGRDGGALASAVGAESTLRAATPCMEALEDVHPLAGEVVARLLHVSEGPVDEALVGTIIEEVDAQLVIPLCSEHIRAEVAALAVAVEDTIFIGGRIFVLGDSTAHPVVTHMDADWGRGLINHLPIPGPERVRYDNINGWMATGNDDGAQYWLVDEFAKASLCAKDVIVFLGGSELDDAFTPCHELAEVAGAAEFIVGGPSTAVGATLQGLPTIPAADETLDLVATMVVHAVSRGVQNHVLDPDGVGWQVTELDLDATSEDVQSFVKTRIGSGRKLGWSDTLSLEQMLDDEGLLPPEKVVTWCYGRPFLVDDPAAFGLSRSFY